MITQLELWSPGWEIEPCGHTDPDPDPARWIHVSSIDPDEAAFLTLHGEPVPRTTVTFHTPEFCCDRAEYH